MYSDSDELVQNILGQGHEVSINFHSGISNVKTNTLQLGFWLEAVMATVVFVETSVQYEKK